MIDEIQLASYCCSDGKDIENYEEAMADKTQKWIIHHRKGLTKDGKFAYSKEELIKMREYYVRPAEELIFMTPTEHNKLHGKAKKGRKLKPRTAEHCAALSKAQKGKKRKPLTAEHRANIGKSAKGNKSTKGMRWYNNGIESKLTYDCPEGFVKGRLIKWKFSRPNK